MALDIITPVHPETGKHITAEKINKVTSWSCWDSSATNGEPARG
ncbi:MAG: hypothetical protein AOA65_0353 [Candidatus Bathyarchaeota archaeon BA1]|nr:MAG: hypothetical protein AOA65_0353 [Candidatus Bathyarchaeota archaeon BA1]